MVVRGGGGGFFAYGPPSHLDRQLWLFIASTAALGACVLLAGLVAVPEYLPAVARVGARWGPAPPPGLGLTPLRRRRGDHGDLGDLVGRGRARVQSVQRLATTL